MTGRATIGGRTRAQIIWAFCKERPATCVLVWRHLNTFEPCTQTAADKALRSMFRSRYLTRHSERNPNGQRHFIYAAAQRHPPPDGRPQNGRLAGKDRDLLPVDPADDEVDDWPRGRGVSKGNATDIPPIPTLAQLLAR